MLSAVCLDNIYSFITFIVLNEVMMVAFQLCECRVSKFSYAVGNTFSLRASYGRDWHRIKQALS